MALIGISACINLILNSQKTSRGGTMKSRLIFTVALVACLVVAGPARAQGTFKVETGKAFDRAVPKDFFLEGNAIPTEKRNSALVITPSGARMVFGLIDTTGYSSQIQQKYTGMLITEGQVEVCGHEVGVGSYGFGLAKGAGEHGEKFMLYNQAGQKVTECSTQRDAKIGHPNPLHVAVHGSSARLYLGRNWVELK
jgi:hypothetical protein